MQISEKIDLPRFLEARATVLEERACHSGIGTLFEKSLHGILKYYIEPDPAYHEVKLCGSIADIKRGDTVVEIQTRSLERLCPKLDKFLSVADVRIVYPLPYEKRISLIDKDSGEIISRRKSPKRASAADAIIELRKIKSYLSHPRLSLSLVFLNVDEYRTEGERVRFGKRTTVRAERIPNSIECVMNFDSPEDYLRLLPESLPLEFTVAELAKAVKLKKRWGYDIVSLLLSLGLIELRGKRGRENVYSKK